MGNAQWLLLVICGLSFCSDAAEVTFLSFVTEQLKCEWGLTEFQETSVTQAVFAGMMFGAPMWGFLADKFGRRPSFLISSAMICVFGFLTACCRTFPQLFVAQMVVGVGVGGLPVGFDIFAESLPSCSRGTCLLYIEYFWTLGSIYVNVIAWLTLERYGWQTFTMLVACPTMVASLVGFFLLPESPLWLVEVHRESEALKILNEWGERNGSARRFRKISESQHAAEEGGNLSGLCTNLQLRKTTALMVLVWFAFGLVYYGIIALLPRLFENGTGDKGGQQDSHCEINFDFSSLAFSSLGEVVGVAFAIVLINRAGRTWSQLIFYGFGGAMVFLLGYTSDLLLLTLCAGSARLSILAASACTWVHTPELFPTKVRAQAHSLLSMTARIGSVLTQFLVSDLVSLVMAAWIMALVSLSAAVAALLLPETAGAGLDVDGRTTLAPPVEVHEVSMTEVTLPATESASGVEEVQAD